MTWPAPTGAPQTEPRLPDRANNPKRTGEASYHPDVLAYARQHGITRGRTLDALQREYERAISARVDREEFAAARPGSSAGPGRGRWTAGLAIE